MTNWYNQNEDWYANSNLYTEGNGQQHGWENERVPVQSAQSNSPFALADHERNTGNYYGGNQDYQQYYSSSTAQAQPMFAQHDQQFYSPTTSAAAPYNLPDGDYYTTHASRRASQPSNYNYAGGMFMPQAGRDFGNSNVPSSVDDIENEPPLLEELGINFDHIKQKTLAVLNPVRSADPSVAQDSDLAGPLCFCLLFGASLLLHGKVHFGYIYGIGVLGCLGIHSLLLAMAPHSFGVLCTVSVLGYCMLPMALLSLLAAMLSFKGWLGLSFACVSVLWCSASSSKLFISALQLEHQRLLVAYPCCLLYGLFALMAIF